MPVEIERKFLVKSLDFINLAYDKKKIIQGYISKSSDANVRIRVLDNDGFITIKGKSDKQGMKRYEWEHKISKEDAIELLEFSKDSLIEKTRYLIKEKNGLVFEVDIFEGANKGLVIAEIELENENQKFVKPNWLGKEVTGVKKYYNSYISTHQYNTWE